MGTNDVIPFGKYKGKPIDVLAQDYEYCDWLMQQDWVRERYGNVYTLIVNNFGEATETPEHNKLQYEFMQEENVLKLIRMIYETTDITVKKIIPEVRGWDVLAEFRYLSNEDDENYWISENIVIELKPCIGDDYPSVLRQMKANCRRCMQIDRRSGKDIIPIDRVFLVYKQYTGTGISEAEMQDFFRRCGFIAVKGE